MTTGNDLLHIYTVTFTTEWDEEDGGKTVSGRMVDRFATTESDAALACEKYRRYKGDGKRINILQCERHKYAVVRI